MNLLSEYNIEIFFLAHDLAGQSVALDRIVVFFADYLAYVLVVVPAVSFIAWKNNRAAKMNALLGALIAILISRGLLVELIQFFYTHPRPFFALSGVHPLLVETSSSFPSGHATVFFALSVFMYRYSKGLG